MRRGLLIGVAVLGFGALATGEIVPRHTQAATAKDAIERGRYLVRIGGCNDCHTPHFAARNGEVAEERWLIGDSVGYSGPWGTTYPSNLRSLLASMDENAWVRYAQTLETRPPMPWFNLRAFAVDDLRAMYRYIRSLPPDDSPVPEYVPPNRRPTTPHIVMVPQPPHP